MSQIEPNTPATVPDQPEAESPVRKGKPIVLALIAIVALIGIANVSSLVSGNKKSAPASALTVRPSTASAQQVSSFETQQQQQVRHDAEQRQKQQELATALQQLQTAQGVPGPEADNAVPMTGAQRQAIYGNSPDAPAHTSNVSQAQAEAKQKALLREKQQQEAINSATVAIDFAHAGVASGEAVSGSADIASQGTLVTTAQATKLPTTSSSEREQEHAEIHLTSESGKPPNSGADPIKAYDFDKYDGRLYRLFEGTVLEGVVTNRINGGLSGPILVMLTTDYYSHDHQQLLMPQGTRLIGTVQSVGNAQQRKMFVTFHRAVCPDGFSIDFDKYIGLDPLGTTGVATNVNNGYFQAFAAAAAVGGLGGLAQIGNNGSVLSSSTQIRNGMSEQTATEGEQILNHFLNRLPVITLKEGSRARVYVGRDILVPSYAEHRVDPTL